MKKVLICFISCLLLSASPTLAGEKIAIDCTSPGCNYTNTLALGGARLAPAITCYCAHCRDFVRIKLQNWDQYHDQEYYCPTCGRAARPLYSQKEFSTVPCPRCGQVTLKTKTLIRFD